MLTKEKCTKIRHLILVCFDKSEWFHRTRINAIQTLGHSRYAMTANQMVLLPHPLNNLHSHDNNHQTTTNEDCLEIDSHDIPLFK